MKPMTNVWLDSLVTFDQVLSYIELNLTTLKENALDANFMSPQVKQQYAQDVTFLKQFFERAESLARQHTSGTVVRLRTESTEFVQQLNAKLVDQKVQGTIVNLNEQIYGWIEKIQDNVTALCEESEITNTGLLDFLAHQYHLLMLIYRALTGRVIFVGARPITPIESQT